MKKPDKKNRKQDVIKNDKANERKKNYFDFSIEILFLFFIAVMPVIFDRRIGIVFSLTKTTFMYEMLLVILTVWVIKLLLKQPSHWVHTPLNWPIVSYMLSCTVATITSVHVYTSFVGFYGRYEGLMTLYSYALCAFIVVNYFHTFTQLKRIAGVIVVTSTMMGIYSIIQRMGIDPYSWGGVITSERVIATIGQPNFLAAYMDMAFMLVFFLFLMYKPLPDLSVLKNTKKYWADQLLSLSYFLIPNILFVVMIYSLGIEAPVVWYIGFFLMGISSLLFAFTFESLHPVLQDTVYFVSLAIGFVGMFYTVSRGGLFGFLVGVILMLFFVGRSILFLEWKKLFAIGCVIVSIMGFYTFIASESSPFARFTSDLKVGEQAGEQKPQQEIKQVVKEKEKPEIVDVGYSATAARIETWKSAFHIISDRPLFGIGPEVLKMVFPKYETDLFRFKENFHVKQDRCHNSIFDVNVTKGMISFALYVWLLFTVFKIGIVSLSKVDAERRILFAALLAGIVSYKIQNQFSFGVVAIGSIYWILMGAVVSLSKESTLESQTEKSNPVKLEDIPWLPMAAVIIVTLFLMFLATRPFMADLYFKKGSTLAEGQRFEEAVREYEKSLAYLPYEGGTRTHCGIAYLNLMQQKGLNPQNLEEVATRFKEASVSDPYNADNFHILGRIYLIEDQMGIPGALDKSKDFSEKALKIDPYYAEVWTNLGVVYEKKGDLKKAAEFYKKAFMINPNLSEPMDRLIQVSARMGQPQGAKDIFIEAVNKYPSFASLRFSLGNMYEQEGNNAKAIEQFGEILKADQNNVSAWLKIGEVYFRMNQLNEAEKALQQVVMIDPKNIDAHNGLGAIYLRAGDREKSKGEFEQVLMLDPSNPYAKQFVGKGK
ncbi:MAG: tetratricopeptide repeat protein [Candidatus Saganbacteria bacterium]|nr:tetratricopeptide repeat protein [Candidatus Saganbacteria bacterium]